MFVVLLFLIWHWTFDVNQCRVFYIQHACQNLFLFCSCFHVCCYLYCLSFHVVVVAAIFVVVPLMYYCCGSVLLLVLVLSTWSLLFYVVVVIVVL